MNSLFVVLLVLGLTVVPNTLSIGLDLRVSPALGSWGNQVRISVVDFTPEETYDGFFSYNARFNYKWTNNSLHSVLVPSTPGTPQKFQIGNTSVVIDLPAVGAGIEGLLFGDPCVIHTSYYWPCLEGIGDRLPTLVNAALDATRPGRASALDFWTILGDNFYDLLGEASHRVFDELTVQSKSVPLITVPGNHDYWVLGHPEFRTPLDQYGNGFMQFYGQDVMAGKSEAVNFLNFSISPHNEQCADSSNFFQYKILGNVGFIGYSGRYSWEEQLPYFQEACSFFAEEKPTWLILYGHWNKAGAGAAPGMDVPTVVSQVKLINGCNVTTGLKGFMGHTHCNEVVTPGEIFMVGGSGFPHNEDEPGCDMAGFVYLRTTETNMELVMFDYTKSDDYFAVLSCIGAHGLSGCTQMGTVWLNQTATPAAQTQATAINA